MYASEFFAEKLPQGYVLQSRLGGHGGCWTYDALDAQGQPCIVKIMDFAHVQSWKQAELFEREIKVLSNLQHPQIPKVLAVGRSPDDSAYWSYAVFEKMPGQSLEQKLKAGWVATKAEALDMALQALDILQYLHQRQPPVVHRDLKPSNIIQDEAGKIYFIDFGALQGTLAQQGSSTVVGSFGYMPPEQFAAQAVPASDLYALGATLVHVLAGLPPTEMPQSDDLRLKFHSYLDVSEAVAQFLEQLLAPDPQARGQAQELRVQLQTLQARQDAQSMALQQSLPALGYLEQMGTCQYKDGHLCLRSPAYELTAYGKIALHSMWLSGLALYIMSMMILPEALIAFTAVWLASCGIAWISAKSAYENNHAFELDLKPEGLHLKGLTLFKRPIEIQMHYNQVFQFKYHNSSILLETEREHYPVLHRVSSQEFEILQPHLLHYVLRHRHER